MEKLSCTCKIQVKVDIGEDLVFLIFFVRDRFALANVNTNAKLGEPMLKTHCVLNNSFLKKLKFKVSKSAKIR